METPAPGLLQQSVVTREHSAFGSGQILRGVKREAGEHRDAIGRGERSDRSALVEGRQRMSGVFDYSQVVFCSDLQYGIAVAGVTVQMNGHDRPHAQAEISLGLCDLVANQLRSEIERVRLDVGEDWRCANMFDDMHGGTERQWRGN